MPPDPKWKITFKNDAVADEYVKASSEEKAIILARAEKIKRGLDDRVESATKVEGNSDKVVSRSGRVYVINKRNKMG